jgi:hypothetical protein
MNDECHWDFRLRWPKGPLVAKYGVQFSCPKCGSLYVEWLSFELDPQDVYLDTDEEWDACPDGVAKVRIVSHH